MLPVIIIGYGNPLRGDDGLGWHAARQLSTQVASSHIQVVACHQLTPELAEDISRCERVIFLDAARTLPAGEIRCNLLASTALGKAVRPVSYSHSMSPVDLLDLCRELYGCSPRAFLISVGGEDFSQTGNISDRVADVLDALVVLVKSLTPKDVS
jgi:hydrogenase maturation protease